MLPNGWMDIKERPVGVKHARLYPLDGVISRHKVLLSWAGQIQLKQIIKHPVSTIEKIGWTPEYHGSGCSDAHDVETDSINLFFLFPPSEQPPGRRDHISRPLWCMVAWGLHHHKCHTLAWESPPFCFLALVRIMCRSSALSFPENLLRVLPMSRPCDPCNWKARQRLWLRKAPRQCSPDHGGLADYLREFCKNCG